MIVHDDTIIVKLTDPHPQFSMRLVSPISSPNKSSILPLKKTEVTTLTTQTTHDQGQITQNYHTFAFFDSPTYYR